MKRKDIVVAILAVLLIALSTVITICFISYDEKKQMAVIDKKVLNDSSLHANRNEGEGISYLSEDIVENDKDIAEDGTPNYNIIVEDGADDSDCIISIVQAVSIGLKSIEQEAGISFDSASVSVSRYDADRSVTWHCVAEVKTDGADYDEAGYRFEFNIDGNSGKLLSSRLYVQDEESKDVWVSDGSTNTLENKIDHQKVEAYNSLDIDIKNAMNIEVQYGDTYSISAKYYGSKNQLSYQVNNGILKITSGSNSARNNYVDTLTLTVPEGTALDSVTVIQECGNYTMEDMPVESINVLLEIGNLTLMNISSSNAIFHVAAGNVEMKKCISKEYSIEVEGGNVNMDSCTSDQNNINVEAGYIVIAGTIMGKTKCTMEAGGVIINCSGLAKDYDYLLKSNIGQVLVNGESSRSELSSNNNLVNMINVNIGVGNAELNFEAGQLQKDK